MASRNLAFLNYLCTLLWTFKIWLNCNSCLALSLDEGVDEPSGSSLVLETLGDNFRLDYIWLPNEWLITLGPLCITWVGKGQIELFWMVLEKLW